MARTSGAACGRVRVNIVGGWTSSNRAGRKLRRRRAGPPPAGLSGGQRTRPFRPSVGTRASYVEVAELRLAAGDRLQFLEERRGGRVAGVGHRFGVAGEFHYGNVPPGVVPVRA